MTTDRDHYLKRELYRLFQTDPRIFDFLEAGSLDGIWYWDIENPREEWLSPRFKELFGYDDDEDPEHFCSGGRKTSIPTTSRSHSKTSTSTGWIRDTLTIRSCATATRTAR